MALVPGHRDPEGSVSWAFSAVVTTRDNRSTRRNALIYHERAAYAEGVTTLGAARHSPPARTPLL
jgi:hypothetical protein